MKKIVFGLMLFLVIGCNGQHNKIENNVSVTNDSIPFNEELSFLIGKWEEVESVNSDGATKYVTKIENGRTLTFYRNGIVIIEKDSIKTNNKYKSQLRKIDRVNVFNVHISSSKDSSYYILSYRDDKKINLTPVTSEYEIICDEGCYSIYQKIE